MERVDEEAFGMKFVCYKLSAEWLVIWCAYTDDADCTGRW